MECCSNKAQTMLIQFPAGKAGSYTVPISVSSIGGRAFGNCTKLEAVYFQGNAPSEGVYVFEGPMEPDIFYLPGTTGWGQSFGHLLTTLWVPEIRTGNASFGVRTNQFCFNIR